MINSEPAQAKEILVCDDDVAMCTMLASSLRRHGYSVTAVSDGENLLNEVQKMPEVERRLGLVICDIQMPGINGLEVLLRLKHFLPSVPVLLITAFGDSHTHRRARVIGAVGIIDKPFDLDWFMEQVAAVLLRAAGE